MVLEERTNIPTTLLLLLAAVRSTPKQTHTHTHIHLRFALDALAPCACVCVAVAAVPVRQQAGIGERGVRSPGKSVLRAIFPPKRAAPLSRNRWFPSPPFLRLGSASPPPRILSLTRRKLGVQQQHVERGPRLPRPGSYVTADAGESRCCGAEAAASRILQRLIMVRYSDCDVAAAGFVNDEVRSSENRREKRLIHHLCLCAASKSA